MKDLYFPSKVLVGDTLLCPKGNRPYKSTLISQPTENGWVSGYSLTSPGKFRRREFPIVMWARCDCCGMRGPFVNTNLVNFLRNLA